jgi:hypothetical protein
LLSNAGWEFNPLFRFLFVKLDERRCIGRRSGGEWEREMITVNWKCGVLSFASPSVGLRASSSTSAGSVEEENTVWAIGTISWINFSVCLLSNVMLRIQESVLGGSDDIVVDLWWRSVDLLSCKLVS